MGTVYMINQAYHLIDMYKPYQKFLDFSWETGEKTCCFIFTVLAFGVTSARAIYIYNSYETSRKTLENKRNQNSLLS